MTRRAGGAAGGAAAKLDWDQVAAWRLRRHHLDRRAPAADALAVVADLAGLHAQIASSAELTLWARVDDLAPDAVRRALWEDRTLVKTWAMRGTLHLLPGTDYPHWQAGLAARYDPKPAWFRAFGGTPEELELLIAGVRDALEGRLLTRQELADEVGRRTGLAELAAKLAGSWGSLLKPAAFRGHLCFGPSAGQYVRFTRPDTWLGHWEPVQPDQALPEVTRTYLGAGGPATREDLARWWGVSPAAGQRMLAGLGEEATAVELDGTRAWMLSGHLAEAQAAEPPGAGPDAVRLLPAFDQYVIAATRHAERLMPGPFADRVYRPQGWLSPVLLVRGRMAGIWRHEVKRRHVDVRIEPFTAQPAWVIKAAEAEAERLAAWLGGTPRTTWAEPA